MKKPNVLSNASWSWASTSLTPQRHMAVADLKKILGEALQGRVASARPLSVGSIPFRCREDGFGFARN